MRDEIITEETAKLAKVKGFDNGCSHLWGEYDGYVGLHNVDNYNRMCSEKQFSAPTQLLLQRWFRRVHGLEVYVKPFYIPQLNREGCFKYYGMVLGKEHVVDCIASSECCDVYEDAFEKALVLALNMIKI